MFNNELWQKPAGGAGGANFYTHQIANSCRFNRANVSRMTRALGTATANTKWTISTWLKPVGFSNDTRYFFGGSGSTYGLELGFRNIGSELCQLSYLDYPTSGIQTYIFTQKSFRDPSAWYHIVVNQDTTLGTASDRIKIYINGELQTAFNPVSSGGSPTPFYPSQNSATINDSIHTLIVGGNSSNNIATSFDGYLAETYFIDGTAYAGSDFAETKNGVWIPKDASGLTFGNNGFYLNYASSADLGNDVSGNNNDYTVANISAHDQMLDSPTFGSSSSGNFCTWNPLIYNAQSLSEGDCRFDGQTNNRSAYGNFGLAIGSKYYVEFLMLMATNYGFNVGISSPPFNPLSNQYSDSTAYGFEILGSSASNWFTQSMIAGTRGSPSSNIGQDTTRVMAITVDRVNHEIKCYLDNVLTYTIAISATAEYSFYAGFSGGANANVRANLNAGQDSTGAGDFSAGTATDENGFGSFQYAPPSGFLAVSSGNLPTADAIDPAQTDDDYPQKLFTTLTYTGDNGGSQTTGFQPDWVWVKRRDGGQSHGLWDSTRGTTKVLNIDNSNAEATSSGLTAFNSTGYTMGTYYNQSPNTYASYSWRVNGGTQVSNGNGGIASTVQVDPSGGFSLVKYTGTGSASTVGHGLSSAPTWIFVKRYDSTNGWIIYTTAMTGSYFMTIDAGGMGADSSYWNNTNSTSSVFSVGTAGATNGGSQLAYCWADVEGYIKSGSYEGNGNADGTFVYTGFRPAFIICKSIDSATSWQLFDDKRVGYNVDNNAFLVDLANAETTTDMIDILSNGFKLRIATDPNIAETYIYLAMAHNPFQYATAR